MSLTFAVSGATVVVDPAAVVIAGFTGRDRVAVEEHLTELQELGVPTPGTTPSFYLATGAAAVQQPRLPVVGADTSGEAEAVLVFDGNDAYLTLGSDHTDRAAEVIDIALSTIAYPKPRATVAWRIEGVAGHADEGPSGRSRARRRLRAAGLRSCARPRQARARARRSWHPPDRTTPRIPRH